MFRCWTTSCSRNFCHPSTRFVACSLCCLEGLEITYIELCQDSWFVPCHIWYGFNCFCAKGGLSKFTILSWHGAISPSNLFSFISFFLSTFFFFRSDGKILCSSLPVSLPCQFADFSFMQPNSQNASNIFKSQDDWVQKKFEQLCLDTLRYGTCACHLAAVLNHRQWHL